jgi:hypothetical protein
VCLEGFLPHGGGGGVGGWGGGGAGVPCQCFIIRPEGQTVN